MKACSLCGKKAWYRDQRTGQYLCPEHVRLEAVARTSQVDGRRAGAPPLAIRAAAPEDYDQIEAICLHFWDETEVDCFDRQYNVPACPAFLACAGDEVVGLASYAVEEIWDAVVLVLLNVVPGYQRRGGSWALLDAVRDEAAQRGLARVLVVTSNDDLPALALYQRYGFRITEVVPGRIAADHGGEFPGLAGIPVRDEIRLAYKVGER